MSVLVNKDTRVLVQGITGKEGSFQTQRCIEYGTHVVAGVTPGRGGEEAHGVPVFDSVAEAQARNSLTVAASCPFRVHVVPSRLRTANVAQRGVTYNA